MKPYDKISLIAEIFYLAIGEINEKSRFIDRGDAFQGHWHSLIWSGPVEGYIKEENPAFMQNLKVPKGYYI